MLFAMSGAVSTGGTSMKIALMFVATACLACSSSNTPKTPVSTSDGSLNDAPSTSDDGPTSGPAADGSVSDGNVSEDFVAALSDFDCNRNSEWTMVGIARYKNMKGHDAEMLAVARSTSGGAYPVGTIVQLNPLEAMVKRGQGFDATSNDWEFFLFNGPPDGGTGVSIANRGGGTSVSNARGTCMSCHAPAQTPFDLVCGDPVEGGPATAHGCMPLAVDPAVLAARPDPKCM
jgi:hypothetical protein